MSPSSTLHNNAYYTLETKQNLGKTYLNSLCAFTDIVIYYSKNSTFLLFSHFMMALFRVNHLTRAIINVISYICRATVPQCDALNKTSYSHLQE